MCATTGTVYSSPVFRWGLFAYALLSGIVWLTSWLWLSENPLILGDPWLDAEAPLRHGYSALLGLGYGSLIVASSRLCLARYEWAQRLQSEFRPFAMQLGLGGIILLALLSSLGEELLFRGLLQPRIGVLAQALLFGLMHQLPGKSRWVWMSWAAAVGLGLGVIFQFTGSLLGPLLAHAMVNGLNLHHLKSEPACQDKRGLGGLLGGDR